jgi:tetratricopeptide (TPR) repeat protein
MLLKLLRQLVASRRSSASNQSRAVASSTVDVRALLVAADRALAGGKPDESERGYRRVLETDPRNADALCGMAVLAARAGAFCAARRWFEAAIAIAPQRVDALTGLGNVYRELDRLDRGLVYLEQARRLSPDSTEVALSLSRALREAGSPAQALAVALEATRANPDRADICLETGLAWADLARYEESRAAIAQTLALDPQYKEAHLARAFDLLAEGDFASGWQEYEWRLGVPSSGAISAIAPAPWDAIRAAGRVHVRAEQGLGDQIMFSSCLPEVLRRVQRCTLTCDQRLASLMRRSFPQLEVVGVPAGEEAAGSAAEASVADVEVPIGSLPRSFRNDPRDFPRHDGYLVADAARVDRWRTQLDRLGSGLKIGVSWRGGVRQTRRTMRSIPLATLGEHLRAVGGAVLVDLQYGDVSAERSAFEQRGDANLHCFPAALEDFDEMAALVCALDIVVSVCTSLVHLAGALGRPVWVLVPKVAEWRYMRSGAGMPWYPTARLFRQVESRNWDHPLEEMASQLQNWQAASPEGQK